MKEKHFMTTDQPIQAFGEEGISQSCDQLSENNWLTWQRSPFGGVVEKVSGNNTQNQSENNFTFVPPHRCGKSNNFGSTSSKTSQNHNYITNPHFKIPAVGHGKVKITQQNLMTLHVIS